MLSQQHVLGRDAAWRGAGPQASKQSSIKGAPLGAPLQKDNIIITSRPATGLAETLEDTIILKSAKENMRISSLLAAAASAALVFASPFSAIESRGGRCLSQRDADTLVKAYTRLISAYSPKDGDKYLSNCFIEYSDSIAILVGAPLGQAIFPNKAAFAAATTSNPFPLVVESVMATDCKTIALTWSGTFGAGKSARGITVITATLEGHWKIKRLDVEFNSIAYLVNMGGSYTLPGGGGRV